MDPLRKPAANPAPAPSPAYFPLPPTKIEKLPEAPERIRYLAIASLVAVAFAILATFGRSWFIPAPKAPVEPPPTVAAAAPALPNYPFPRTAPAPQASE